MSLVSAGLHQVNIYINTCFKPLGNVVNKVNYSALMDMNYYLYYVVHCPL